MSPETLPRDAQLSTGNLPPAQRDAVGFILRLGRALHSYGYAANQLEEVMDQAAQRLGLRGQFFTTPTSIFAAFGPQEDQRTFLIRVEPGGVDLGRLAVDSCHPSPLLQRPRGPPDLGGCRHARQRVQGRP